MSDRDNIDHDARELKLSVRALKALSEQTQAGAKLKRRSNQVDETAKKAEEVDQNKIQLANSPGHQKEAARVEIDGIEARVANRKFYSALLALKNDSSPESGNEEKVEAALRRLTKAINPDHVYLKTSPVKSAKGKEKEKEDAGAIKKPFRYSEHITADGDLRQEELEALVAVDSSDEGDMTDALDGGQEQNDAET